MAPAASRSTILRLINAAQHSACPCHSCSTTTNLGPGHILSQMRKYATPVNTLEKEYAFEASIFMIGDLKVLITSEWVQVAASNLRFGDGVTAEVGMDLKNMKARKVCNIKIIDVFVNLENLQVGVFTDPNVSQLTPMKTVSCHSQGYVSTLHSAVCNLQTLASLQAQDDLPFEVFDQVVCEPTEDSWRDAIAWARKHNFSHFLAFVLLPRIDFETCANFRNIGSVGGGSVIDTAKAANL